MSSNSNSNSDSGSNPGKQLTDSLGHPEEKTRTGKFVDKITGADKAEKLIDYAWNKLTGKTEGGDAAGSSGGAQQSTGTHSSSTTGSSSNGAKT